MARTVKVCMTIDKDVKKELDELAEKSNNSLSALATKIIRDNIGKYTVKGHYQI